MTRKLTRGRSAMVVGSIGGILGAVGAFGVWNFIYSIGGRVVTDEIHYRLAATVEIAGLLVGTIAGVLIGTLPLPMWHSAVLPFFLAMVCVLLGCVGGTYGWQMGLAAFFWLYLMTIVICSYCLIRYRS